ncbi:unnamed protein product [Durusdinium trenchii]|uniref:Uncharacterized protein n=1 Tax=Durusdinium trenchii TaxID=1381693 RepID=A0ABP0HEY2_9DINO
MCMNVLYRLSMMILRELDQMRSRLAAVDQMEAKPPEKPEGEAMGPRPKAKTSQLHVEPVESKYVPPVTIDPKLLWSSCGKALPSSSVGCDRALAVQAEGPKLTGRRWR